MSKILGTNIVGSMEYIYIERGEGNAHFITSYLESMYDKNFFNTINEVIIHHEMGCVFDLIFKYVLPNTIHI